MVYFCGAGWYTVNRRDIRISTGRMRLRGRALGTSAKAGAARRPRRTIEVISMTKRKLFLALPGAVCVALAALLAAGAVGICREGLARKAEHPLESVYTPQIVAEKLAPLAPLFLAGVALLIAGLALGVRDERAERPAEDAELRRDLLAERVARPSGAMLRERRSQRRLRLAGWGAFALCMARVLAYLLNPAHFPEDDPEGMFTGLMQVLLPWTAAGLGALAAASILREKSALREARAAQARLREERAEGVAAQPKPVDPPKRMGGLQALLIVAAVALIVAGALNGSARDVLYKAIAICSECVGLG